MRKRVYIFIFCFPLLVLGYIFFQWYIWYQFYEQRQLYNEERYEEILSALDNERLLIDPAYLHNLGNTNYELFDPAEKNIEVLLESLKYYSWALLNSDHPDTQFNYDVVMKLLNETLSSWGGSEQEEKTQDEGTQQEKEIETPQEESEEESDTWESPDTQKKQESEQDLQINKRDEEYKLDEGQNIWELSPREQREIDETIEELKQEQKVNQQFFKKQPQEGRFNNAFDMLFEEDINRGWEKDW